MARFNFKLYFFLGIFLSGVLVFLLFFLPFWERKEEEKKKTVFLSPTPSSVFLFFPPTAVPTPFFTLVLSPPSFTGVNLETPSEEDLALTQKIYQLKKRVPLRTADFELNYDYGKEVFLVFLPSLSEEEKEKFFRWLKMEDLLLPQEYFLFSTFPSPT